MKRSDPLLRNLDLPLSASYFPAGFRLNIATNSRDVLAAAEEAWGSFLPEFDDAAMELRIIVQKHGDLAPETVYRMQGDLFSIVSDRENHAVFSSTSMSGFCYVSAKTAADHAWFRWHFLEGMVYMMLAQRRVTPVHAAGVVRNGSGVLLSGQSGAGKSTLAYACARAGWTYVGDDAIMLLSDSDDRIGIGKPHQIRLCDDAPELFPELQPYTTRARPNGKLAMEVPTADFPDIQTAARCSIDAVVLLQRRPGPARAESISPSEVLENLLQAGPWYGEEVYARHQRSVQRIADRPCYRMRYDKLNEAVDLLATLTCREHQ
jgi:hypothetical protein